MPGPGTKGSGGFREGVRRSRLQASVGGTLYEQPIEFPQFRHL